MKYIEYICITKGNGSFVKQKIKMRTSSVIQKETIMTVRQVRGLLFESNKYAVIGPDEMTNTEAWSYLYKIKEQDKTTVNVINKGDYLLIFNQKINSTTII